MSADSAVPLPTDLITLAEAAALLGIKKSRISQLVADGRIPAAPLPTRERLVSRADVLAHKPKAIGRPPKP